METGVGRGQDVLATEMEDGRRRGSGHGDETWESHVHSGRLRNLFWRWDGHWPGGSCVSLPSGAGQSGGSHPSWPDPFTIEPHAPPTFHNFTFSSGFHGMICIHPPEFQSIIPFSLNRKIIRRCIAPNVNCCDHRGRDWIIAVITKCFNSDQSPRSRRIRPSFPRDKRPVILIDISTPVSSGQKPRPTSLLVALKTTRFIDSNPPIPQHAASEQP